MLLRRLYCVLYIVSAVHISHAYQRNTACTKPTVLRTAHFLVVHILYAYQRNTACAKLTVLRTVLHIILDTHSVYIYIDETLTGTVLTVLRTGTVPCTVVHF
jgi:hypothetical protein